MLTFQYTFVIYMVYCIVGSAVVTDCFLGEDAGCGPQPDRSRHGIARHPCGEYHTIETGVSWLFACVSFNQLKSYFTYRTVTVPVIFICGYPAFRI
jgi:hypothetical protein